MTVKCNCGSIADPTWGQCYECWLRDRLDYEEPIEEPEPSSLEMMCNRYRHEFHGYDCGIPRCYCGEKHGYGFEWYRTLKEMNE